MNTCSEPVPLRAESAPVPSSADDSVSSCIYSFRCSRGMEKSLSRLMRERGLNRTSVIRLALYALDCFSRRRGVQELSLARLVEELEGLAPDARVSFSDFIRGE